MKTIAIEDEVFEEILSEDDIQTRVKELAAVLHEEHQNEDVVFVVILKGSLFIAADLIRTYPGRSMMEVIRARSYKGKKSSGMVEVSMTETADLSDKTVIIIEDIVETGKTIQAIHHHLRLKKPGRLLTLSLLRKPSALSNPVAIDYVGFEIDQAFVIGYGLDYDERFRELRSIYQLKE